VEVSRLKSLAQRLLPAEQCDENTEVSILLTDDEQIKQLNREYKVKDKDLAVVFMKVYNASQGFAKVSFKHVRREFNKEADALVNKALDERAGK